MATTTPAKGERVEASVLPAGCLQQPLQDGACAPLADATPCSAGLCMAGACTPDESTTTDSDATSDPGTDSTSTNVPTSTGGDDPDPGSSDDSGASSSYGTPGAVDGACGCHSSAPASLWLALLALLALPRRRR